MKNMTHSNARKIGKVELRRVFMSCKFRDALTLNESSPLVDDFVFYYNRADNPKNNYIVYEVISTNVHTRADDVIMGRDFLAQIDVFSAKSFESKLMTETLAKLEEKLVSAGFEIEETNEQYEPDTRLYHQSMVISKIII